MIHSIRILIGITTFTRIFASEPLPTAPVDYKVLRGENGQGSGFVIRYYRRLCGVSSLHQFEGQAPAFFTQTDGTRVSLKTDRVVKQNDVQTLALLDENAAIPFLAYEPVFRFRDSEPVWVFDADGAPVEATVMFTTLALEYHSIEGPKTMEAQTRKPIRALGASGTPIVLKSTGAVIGVLLGANDAESASVISFETLCLPDLTIKPKAQVEPQYTDAKQREVYDRFLVFAKRFPAIHWRAAQIYLRALDLGEMNVDTLEEFVSKNKISETEVNSTGANTWTGSLKLADEKIPSEYWRYQFQLKDNEWVLSKGQKILGSSTLDLLTGSLNMREAFAQAFSEATSRPQKP